MKNLKIEIIVTNKAGSVSSETYHGDYDKVYNNEWDEITRGLIDEAVSEKEF